MNINSMLPATPEQTSKSEANPVGGGNDTSYENTFASRMDEVSAQQRPAGKSPVEKSDAKNKREELPDTENVSDATVPETTSTPPSDVTPQPAFQNFTFAERNGDNLTEGQMQLLSLASENTQMPGNGTGKGTGKGDTALIRGSINMLRGNATQQPPLRGMPGTKTDPAGVIGGKLKEELGQKLGDSSDPDIDIVQAGKSTADKALALTENNGTLLTENNGTPNQSFSQTTKPFSLNTPDMQQLNTNPATPETQAAPIASSPSNSNSPLTEISEKGSLSLQTPVTNPAWAKALGQQIVGLVHNSNQRVTLHLNPVEMGPLLVELNVSDQQAQVQFTSANPQVRSALESAIPELRDTLAEQGISLGETMVGDHPSNQQQQVKNSQKNGSGDAIDEQPLRPNELQGDGLIHEINGRINLYV